jgi:hypothetical protein
MQRMPPKAQFTRNRSGKRTATPRQNLGKHSGERDRMIATEGAAVIAGSIRAWP